ARPLRGPGRNSDPAEPLPDRRAVADGAVPWARRRGAGLGLVSRRSGAVPMADGLLCEGRRAAAAAPAEVDPGRAANPEDHGAWRARRRRHPVKSSDLDRPRLAAAGRLRVVTLF